MDDHKLKEEENESVGDLSTVCSQNVLKCLCLARIGRLDISWSVNKFARAVTKFPTSWMCKKQTSVSHSSTEAEIISLDAGSRNGRYSRSYSLGFGDNEVVHSVPNQIGQPKEEFRGDTLQATKPNLHKPIQFKHTHVIPMNIDHPVLLYENDCQRSKSHNETHVKNPQKCSGLVV